MTDPAQWRLHCVRPTLEFMGLWSQAAENLLMGTALVESGLTYLVQHGGGPARGFYQIEPATLADLYTHYLPRHEGRRASLAALRADAPWRDEQLTHNGAFSTAVARLIYWRRPEPLPPAEDIEGLAAYWKAHFNTVAGKGRAWKFVQAYNKHGRDF